MSGSAITKRRTVGTIASNAVDFVDYGAGPGNIVVVRNLGPETLYLQGLDGDAETLGADVEGAFVVDPGQSVTLPDSSTSFHFFGYTIRGTTTFVSASVA